MNPGFRNTKAMRGVMPMQNGKLTVPGVAIWTSFPETQMPACRLVFIEGGAAATVAGTTPMRAREVSQPLQDPDRSRMGTGTAQMSTLPGGLA